MNHSTLLRTLWAPLFVAALTACGGGGGDTPPPRATCTPGASDGCPGGQICNASGVCEAVGVQEGLTIEAPAARACEILLESGSAEILGVAFDADTRGVWRARSPRVAIAVTRTGDSPFGAGAVNVTVQGDPAAVTVRSVACYDANGAAVSGATAALK